MQDKQKSTELRRLMENVNLRVCDVATDLKKSRATVARWRDGRTVMPYKQMDALLTVNKLTRGDIPRAPKAVKYDSEGYPPGFTNDDLAPLGLERGEEELGPMLEAVEGVEYAARRRERKNIKTKDREKGNFIHQELWRYFQDNPEGSP